MSKGASEGSLSFDLWGTELLHTREVGLTQEPGTLAEAPHGYFCHHYPSEQEESPASVSDLKRRARGCLEKASTFGGLVSGFPSELALRLLLPPTAYVFLTSACCISLLRDSTSITSLYTHTHTLAQAHVHSCMCTRAHAHTHIVQSVWSFPSTQIEVTAPGGLLRAPEGSELTAARTWLIWGYHLPFSFLGR